LVGLDFDHPLFEGARSLAADRVYAHRHDAWHRRLDARAVDRGQASCARTAVDDDAPGTMCEARPCRRHGTGQVPIFGIATRALEQFGTQDRVVGQGSRF
jgi:hypothetical protein